MGEILGHFGCTHFMYFEFFFNLMNLFHSYSAGQKAIEFNNKTLEDLCKQVSPNKLLRCIECTAASRRTIQPLDGNVQPVYYTFLSVILPPPQ
uniref:Uncharacterized protein n=1 Tax=Pyxicephalus adspersus TaxID=30357 RepID=A0AAV2ZIX6_PYXAD|nr:TPA: hypothetical protein GDO54_016044 [Pyxicephalus adspersus]